MRNQLGDGRGIDKMGSRLTPFGVAVVQEMNRLGMMVGVSHLSANGVLPDCHMPGVNLRRANLMGSVLVAANLSNANSRGFRY